MFIAAKSLCLARCVRCFCYGKRQQEAVPMTRAMTMMNSVQVLEVLVDVAATSGSRTICRTSLCICTRRCRPKKFPACFARSHSCISDNNVSGVHASTCAWHVVSIYYMHAAFVVMKCTRQHARAHSHTQHRQKHRLGTPSKILGISLWVNGAQNTARAWLPNGCNFCKHRVTKRDETGNRSENKRHRW